MTFLAAAIQMDTGKDVEQNWTQAKGLVEQAAKAGAKLVVLPEHALLEGRCENERAKEVFSLAMERFAALAKELGLFLQWGTIFEPGPQGKPYNCTMLFDPQGKAIASYRKTHLFDVDVAGEVSMKESDVVSPGQRFTCVDTKEVGRMGFSICYDLRFAEQFRLLALEGANLFTVVANFTYPTGKAHWELLLRARAAENGAYVIAAGQCGKKSGYEAYGHSMIIDPWGKVLAQAGEEPTVVMAPISLFQVDQVREQLGLFSNRRQDLYTLKRTDFV